MRMDKGDNFRYRKGDRLRAAGRLGDARTGKINRYVSYANLKRALKTAPENKVQKKRSHFVKKKILSRLNKVDGNHKNHQPVDRAKSITQQVQATGNTVLTSPPTQNENGIITTKSGFNYAGFLAYQQQQADSALVKKPLTINRPCTNQDGVNIQHPEEPKESSRTPQIGYKIVISNIQPSVSQIDIQELFQDIGPIYSAKFLKPGIVEVMYKKIEDAQNAIRTYNNVNLDGQPMRCVIINKNVNQNQQVKSTSKPGNGKPNSSRPFSKNYPKSKV